jgi:hypothetical protein
VAHPDKQLNKLIINAFISGPSLELSYSPEITVDPYPPEPEFAISSFKNLIL